MPGLRTSSCQYIKGDDAVTHLGPTVRIFPAGLWSPPSDPPVQRPSPLTCSHLVPANDPVLLGREEKNPAVIIGIRFLHTPVINNNISHVFSPTPNVHSKMIKFIFLNFVMVLSDPALL